MDEVMNYVRLVPETETNFVVPSSTLMLVANWDASISASVTESGGLVSQWADQSGNAHHLTQSTGVNKPFYPGLVQNGLNSMNFGTASAVTFLDATFAVNQRFLIFIVHRTTNTTGVLIMDDQTGSNRVTVTGDNDGILHQQQISAGTNTLTSTTNTGSTWSVFCGDFNGPSSAIYINGVSEVAGSIGLKNISSIRFGCRFDGTTLPYFGSVAEVRIYTGLYMSDITSITTSLRTKWGI